MQMKIGFYQFNPKFGKIEENVKKVESALYRGTARRAPTADLIVLPECFNTGYLFLDKEEVARFAEEIPGGYTTQKLIKIAKSKKMFIVAGLAEKHGKKFYNSAVIVGPGGYIDTYRKIHLFNEEKLLFSPGNKPFKVYDIKKAKIGIMVCFDWYFPESARTLALRGAQIICQPANLVLPHCPNAMITRSLENRVFSITANRIGQDVRGEKRLTYIGKSQILSPLGEKIVSAGEEEVLKICEIDPSQADNKKILRHNDLFKDRRPKFYQ